jgi:hypothetical protein
VSEGGAEEQAHGKAFWEFVQKHAGFGPGHTIGEGVQAEGGQEGPAEPVEASGTFGVVMVIRAGRANRVHIAIDHPHQ